MWDTCRLNNCEVFAPGVCLGVWARGGFGRGAPAHWELRREGRGRSPPGAPNITRQPTDFRSLFAPASAPGPLAPPLRASAPGTAPARRAQLTGSGGRAV